MITNRSANAIKDIVLSLLDSEEVISQERLESFINNKFHWKSLTPFDQMKIAKELYAYRQSDKTVEL
jgi:hypothetical protein